MILTGVVSTTPLLPASPSAPDLLEWMIISIKPIIDRYFPLLTLTHFKEFIFHCDNK